MTDVETINWHPKGTPGPWFIQKETIPGRFGITAKNGRFINWAMDASIDGQGTVNARAMIEAPAMVALLRDMLPENVCTTNPNIRDDLIVPLDVPMGELRRIAAILARIDGGCP